MYGFPKDLDLSHLVGGELIRISIDQYNLLFEFDPQNTINISGKWVLRNEQNEIFDQGVLETEKESYKVHKLVGQKIQDYEISSPKSIKFIFENNWELELIDNSDQYETCSISPDIYV